MKGRSRVPVEVLVDVIDLDFEIEVHEVGERVHEPRRREVIANLATLAGGTDEAAPPETGQVVRYVRSPDLEASREVRRVGRPLEEHEEYAAPGGVGQRGPHPLECFATPPPHTGNTTSFGVSMQG